LLDREKERNSVPNLKSSKSNENKVISELNTKILSQKSNMTPDKTPNNISIGTPVINDIKKLYKSENFKINKSSKKVNQEKSFDQIVKDSNFDAIFTF